MLSADHGMYIDIECTLIVVKLLAILAEEQNVQKVYPSPRNILHVIRERLKKLMSDYH